MTARLQPTLVLLTLLMGNLPGGDAPSTGSSATSVKLLVDSNIYLQSEVPLGPGQTAPSLPADARDTVVVAGFNLGWSGQTPLGISAQASYAPDVVRFSRYETEDHTNHRLMVNLSRKTSVWTFEAKNSLLITEGGKEPLVFNRLGGGSSLGGEPVRARRAQSVAKAAWRVSHPVTGGFVRATFNLLNQDFHVRESPVSGCANYVDRREWSVGAEGGSWLHPGFAAIGAVRAGRQTQADLLGTRLNYSNTFTRWLVGFEGAPMTDLKLSLLAGPDLRRYGDSVRTGFDRAQTTTYVEGTASWVASTADILTFGVRRWQWLNSGGRAAYLDLSVDAGWKHLMAPGWTLAVTANVHRGSCTRYNPGSPRDDVIYTGNLGVTRTLSAGTIFDAGLMHDWSDSRVAGAPSREYSRWIASASWSQSW